MRIAFYAPLKAPDSPTPSGDRLIARMLAAAMEKAGHSVEIASRLRSFDREGDRRAGAGSANVTMLAPSRQQRLHQLADRIALRLIRRWMQRPPAVRPQLWFTYHLYHKAPDWIGPRVAQSFGIPYVVAEASLSQRQAQGPWAYGHRGVLKALAAADLVVALNPKDIAGVQPALRPATDILRLPPFIDTAPFIAASRQRTRLRADLATALDLNPDWPWLVTVAMMRQDVKRESYSLLANAVRPLAGRAWHLLIVGDGAAAGAVKADFSPVANHVRFLGEQPLPRIAEVLAASDLFVWPAIAEAIGMVFLEAQAAGLPVIGADRPGVAGVVAHGETGLLLLEGDAAALTAAIAGLSANAERRHLFGRNAQARISTMHDLAVASERLSIALSALLRPPT